MQTCLVVRAPYSVVAPLDDELEYFQNEAAMTPASSPIFQKAVQEERS